MFCLQKNLMMTKKISSIFLLLFIVECLIHAPKLEPLIQDTQEEQ